MRGMTAITCNCGHPLEAHLRGVTGLPGECLVRTEHGPCPCAVMTAHRTPADPRLSRYVTLALRGRAVGVSYHDAATERWVRTSWYRNAAEARRAAEAGGYIVERADERSYRLRGE